MISIITPTYNRELLLQTTIKSIQSQTFTDWELIVVDDGSTDNTEKVIQQYLADSRIKYVKKENTGQAHSLNVGVSYASGDFITFLDSDDEAYPNWLQVANANIKSDTGILCTGAIRKLLNGRKVKKKLWKYKLFGENLRLMFTCGSLFIKRRIFNDVGGYDIKLKSNIQTDLGYRMLVYLHNSNYKIVSLDEYLVQINIHNGPRIRTNWDKMKDGGMQFLEKHFDFIKKNNPTELSNICAVIAFANYKLRNRQSSVSYLFKAIKYNPLRLVNYVRLLKYSLM